VNLDIRIPVQPSLELFLQRQPRFVGRRVGGVILTLPLLDSFLPLYFGTSRYAEERSEEALECIPDFRLRLLGKTGSEVLAEGGDAIGHLWLGSRGRDGQRGLSLSLGLGLRATALRNWSE
jgi:hypothetical protein